MVTRNIKDITTNNPSLAELATYYKTDKEGGHHYAAHYQFHFESRRFEKLNILEIGIGGYENPKEGGASLRMWKAFFPNSNIYGLDIYDKSYHDEERIKTFMGSQIDEEFLKKVVSEIGKIDIIIDDGSHISEHVIKTFQILFPYLSYNGIYVIEDLQTSYWENVQGENWGGSRDLKAQFTSMNFLKDRVDRLNYEEFTLDQEAPSYFDKMISSMHFYHNLVFIYKGLNCEGSNILGRRTGAIKDVLDGNIDPNSVLKNRLDLQCRWLNIELSSVCNLRCRWCILDHTKPKEFLKLEQFENILKQIASGDLPFLERIDIHNGGEVFLHPQIDEILLLLDKYRPLINPAIHIAILTNGTVLKDSSLAILSQNHPVDEIRVSVDGGSPDEFEYIRTNAKWDKVSENVRRMHKSLKENNSDTKLGIICMVAPEKSLDVKWMTPEFKSVVELADNLEIRHPHTWEGSLNGKDGLVAQTSQKHKKRICKFLKKNIVVMANGDVTVCCADLNRRGVVGSVENNNLDHILFDTKRTEMIKLWQEGRFDEIPICSTCEGYYDEPYPIDDPNLTVKTEEDQKERLLSETIDKFENELTAKNFFAANLLIQNLQKYKAFEHILKAKKLKLDEIILEERRKNKWTSKKSAELVVKAEKQLENKQLGKAKKLLLETLNLDPIHIEALINLSVVYILEENYSQAKKIIDIIFTIDPENEIAKGNLNYLLENNFLSSTSYNELSYTEKVEKEFSIYESQKVVHDLPKSHDVYIAKSLSPKLTSITGYSNFWEWCAGEIDELTQKLDRKVKCISIGCGNGDSEVNILERVKNKSKVKFIGIDINYKMLERGRKLANQYGFNMLEFRVGDFNNLMLDDKYDFFFANHSLHHVVELEKLFEAISKNSSDEMVFMINDMIGRNGHVLWDGTKKVVDSIWAMLEKKYKLNAYSNNYDEEVLNHDCSKEGFEGIRAQDILPLLLNYFDYQVYLPFSVIVGRFIDRAYGHNFDVNNKRDMEILNEIITIDLELLRDNKLSATQAQMKFVKKGKSIESKYVFQTPEQTIAARNNNYELTKSFLNQLQNLCEGSQ